jgi:hypothetical protein
MSEEKRKQWELIKAEAPDVAEFLANLSEQFGKPEAILVELKSGKVIESGEFDGTRLDWDGKLRSRGYGKH